MSPTGTATARAAAPTARAGARPTARATAMARAAGSHPAGSRAALTVVPAAAWRPKRAPFALLSLLVVGVGLLGLLGLNTVLAEDAFRRHDLERQAALLSEREQQLASDVAALEAPERLAVRAAELGLVPAGPPAFLRLSDGAVLGSAVAPAAPPAPVAAITPSATPASMAKPAARAKPAASAKPSASAKSASSAQPAPKPAASARPTPSRAPATARPTPSPKAS